MKFGDKINGTNEHSSVLYQFNCIFIRRTENVEKVVSFNETIKSSPSNIMWKIAQFGF